MTLARAPSVASCQPATDDGLVVEPSKTALDVERQPTRELPVRRVLPEAVPAAAPHHIVDEIAQAVAIGEKPQREARSSKKAGSIAT